MLTPRQPKSHASGRVAAKYAIVGAGYTGLAAARRLSELDPGAEIVVLEATIIGEGSSARNSGFASPSETPGGVSTAAIARNEAHNRLGREGFDWLKTLIDENSIDCDLRKTGRIKGAATERGEKSLRASLDILRRLEIPHSLLSRNEMSDLMGSSYYRRGLLTEEGYLLQPAALIRGLADSLPDRIRLFEQTPVLELKRTGKWRLRTPDATVTADYVIMAANASVKNFGYLRARLVTIFTYAALTEPLPKSESEAFGMMGAWGLLPVHRLGTTVRRVGADRLMVRSLYSYERGVPWRCATSALLTRFRRRYPDLAHIQLEYAWGGTTALTLNGAPYWGRIDDGLFTAAGCNGVGIVKGTVLGKRLAEHITGKDVADEVIATYGKASWIAPEPVRSIGFHAVSAVQRRIAGLES